VSYLNARPLVYGLGRVPDRFALRFDLPSVCATLLGDGSIDLGTIPSVEYARAPGYCIVPDVAIASRGPVASVALFARRPLADLRTVAVDTSSRTSAALLHVLCARYFGIAPSFEPMAPDPAEMLRRTDAALIIGDAALFLDHEASGLAKIDLGEAWTAMTGTPFVWAVWAGRAGAIGAAEVAALQAARDGGVANADAVATDYAGGDARRAEIGRAYLRTNMCYQLDAAARAGLEGFLRLSGDLGLAPQARALRFF
jgi:chorismate dehydratase